MYARENYKSKASLKRAANSEKGLFSSDFFQPNNMFGREVPTNGVAAVCGPHFPQAHKWYAEVFFKNGRVTKVK